MSHGCFNRAPFAPSIQVADGWENSWARRMVDMEFRMSLACQYRETDLGKADPKCSGCRWRTDGQADTGTEVAGNPGERPAGDVAGSGGEEGEGSGGAGAGRLQDASKAAEAKRRFEETWPAAQIYKPTEEK